MALTLMLSFTTTSAQIKNATIETVLIFGNCDRCKSSIEAAGNIKRRASVDWDKDTRMATLTYDALQTNQDEILKRIALAGYNNEKYYAPEDAYSKLPECCQYDSAKKTIAKVEALGLNTKDDAIQNSNEEIWDANQLKSVFDRYFSLKDALVSSDANTASQSAAKLLAVLKEVKMQSLPMEVHIEWMKVSKDLIANTLQITTTKAIDEQRQQFMSLSKNMFSLMKVSKSETPIYYQFCPMANNGKGANWLSKESTIKNPYYGSQMLNCGKTVETIK
ncbi:mercury transporter [Arenibacter sp. H213]|nr:mercury transporter [Arenibacter sp. H213]